ncbi:MAG: phosphatidylserine/phosphatidylglycerophosphate/cardiolipin synthase family protein [Gaiellales bacterium]
MRTPSTTSADTAWQLFDETTATAAIVDAINGAHQVVNAEFFGFSDAGKGAQVVSALANAAKRGVEVNVLTDFISSLALPLGSYKSMRSKIEDAGGSVILTSRIPFSNRGQETPALKHVDHRKVVTIDGSTGFVGGMNFVKITDDYHDTMAQLGGTAAGRLAADQMERWKRVGGAVSDRHSASVRQALDGAARIPSDRTEFAIINNAPDVGNFEVTNAYRDMIRGAKERLWISSPGISDRAVMDDINAAASRGVDVRIIAPGSPPTGMPPIQWIGRAHMANLDAHGGSSWEIPEVLHRKALIADDEAVLSSYNLTVRSAKHDHEVGIRTADPEFVEAISGIFERDISRGKKFDPTDHTGLSARIGAFLARTFSY